MRFWSFLPQKFSCGHLGPRILSSMQVTKTVGFGLASAILALPNTEIRRLKLTGIEFQTKNRLGKVFYLWNTLLVFDWQLFQVLFPEFGVGPASRTRKKHRLVELDQGGGLVEQLDRGWLSSWTGAGWAAGPGLVEQLDRGWLSCAGILIPMVSDTFKILPYLKHEILILSTPKV
jgi:hypothetical protein